MKPMRVTTLALKHENNGSDPILRLAITNWRKIVYEYHGTGRKMA
jgi:hypothetical protein